jgi:hypothetical protein
MYIPMTSEDHLKEMFKSFVTGELKVCVRNNSNKTGFIHMSKVFIA